MADPQNTEPRNTKPTPRERTRRPARSNPARRFITRWRGYGVAAFAVLMVIGGVVGLLFFARPTTSDVENRYLTEFPEFTVERFLDGSYFSDFSLWYADTYPLREPMVKASQDMKGLFGIQPDTRLIGGNRESDELPTEGEAVPEVSREHSHDVSAPEVKAAAAEIENQISDGVYITDGQCYTLYYFSKEATQNYASVVNDAAEMLGDEAQVYSILIPTNAGALLGKEDLEKLGVPDQEQAIDYFYSLMSDDIITVPTYATLHDHRDEYIFFRTDFHWTQLGAYYVYLSFCQQKDIEPAPFFDWEEMVFEPFWGEYASMTDISSFTPDAVEARIPQGTNTMTYWQNDYTLDYPSEGPIVEDVSRLADNDAGKYNCFVCGNQPLSYIENPAVTDGSSCLIIKDSFGNPLVATMVDNYQYIWTVDFRFTSQKMLDLVREHDIQDVIFENTIMFAGTNNCYSLLSSIVYPDETEDE